MEKDGPEYGLYGDHAALDTMLAGMDAELGADRGLQATVPLLMTGGPGLDLCWYVEGGFGPGAGPKLAVGPGGAGSWPFFGPA